MSAALRRAARRVAGFSLIEVLVSMCILATGVLALAALAHAVSRFGAMSAFRSTAALLAEDLADRIRANATGAALGAGGYDIGTRGWPSPVSSARAACTASAPCGPADLARADLAVWTALVRASLPAGSGYVRFYPAGAGAGASVDVWVAWADPAVRADGAPTERGATECPADWSGTASSVRCVGLKVGL